MIGATEGDYCAEAAIVEIDCSSVGAGTTGVLETTEEVVGVTGTALSVGAVSFFGTSFSLTLRSCSLMSEKSSSTSLMGSPFSLESLRSVLCFLTGCYLFACLSSSCSSATSIVTLRCTSVLETRESKKASIPFVKLSLDLVGLVLIVLLLNL